jgi:micrococcal nuclease
MTAGGYKQVRLIALFLFLLFTTAAYSHAQQRHAVRWVSDGDTIILNDGRRVRYIGINAPEIDHENQKAQPFGYEARSFNIQLVSTQRIRLELDKERHDRYGRWLAYIFLSDGSFVNARLLQNGFAYYLYRKPNVKYDKLLLKAQQEAMKAKKGLWRRWKEEKGMYIGNRKSMRFHLPTCPFAQNIKRKNRVNFATKWDAFTAGYAPAKKCIEKFWSYKSED